MQVTGSIRIPFVVNGVDGKDGNGIASVTEEYALHTSGTTAPTDGWSDTISNPTKLQPYLWNRETTTYTDGATRYVPAHVIAMYSADGRGIKSVTNYYLASDQSSGITNETEGFTTDVQEISEEKPYLWNFEEITYDDEEGTTEKTQACIIGVYGLNGIMLVVPAYVNFAPTVTTLTFYVAAWRGKEQLVTATSQVSPPTEYGDGITAARVRGIDESKGVLCEITRTAGAVIDWTGEWSVTIEGIAYPFTVTATSVANGEKGDKGDTGETGSTGTPGAPGEDGEDAEMFEIVPSSSNLVYYPGRRAYAPETLTFRLRHTKGSESEDYYAYWKVTETLVELTQGGTPDTGGESGGVTPPDPDGEEAPPKDYEGENITVTPTNTDASLAIALTVVAYDDSGRTLELARYTMQATSSASLRIRVWDNVAAVDADSLSQTAHEMTFEDGSAGRTYLDVVQHNYTNTLGVTQELWYMCKESHIKSTEEEYEPWHDATADSREHKGIQTWTQASKFDMICTQVLLANYAKIENLYVDDVYMETDDGKTAIWMNPALEGMLIRKLEDLRDKGRENQAAADWSNPTTAFTAKELPAVEDIYGTDNAFSGNGSVTDSVSNNYSSIDLTDSTVISVKSVSSSISGITSGDVVKVTVTTSLSATMRDGADATGSPKLALSQVRYELRMGWSSSLKSNNYRTVWSWTVNGSGVSGTSSTSGKDGKIDVSLEAEGSTLYLILYRISYGMRPQSSVSVTGSISMSGYYVTAKYISQYTAGGVFIGLSSQDYLRVGMNKTGEARHTLLAGGNGLDIQTGAMFQYKGGNRMPFAYTLLAGYFSPDGMSLSADYWTFDDADCTVEYRSLGWYVVTMPSSWTGDYGFDLAAGKSLCVTVSVHRDNSMEGAYAKVNNIENRTISVTTHGADGAMADFPFFLRVDYFPSTKSATASRQSYD